MIYVTNMWGLKFTETKYVIEQFEMSLNNEEVFKMIIPVLSHVSKSMK